MGSSSLLVPSTLAIRSQSFTGPGTHRWGADGVPTQLNPKPDEATAVGIGRGPKPNSNSNSDASNGSTRRQLSDFQIGSDSRRPPTFPAITSSSGRGVRSKPPDSGRSGSRLSREAGR